MASFLLTDLSPSIQRIELAPRRGERQIYIYLIMVCAQSLLIAIAIAIILIVFVAAQAGGSPRLSEGYGAADEPHAGLNPAACQDSSPRGWPGLIGVRGDTTSALATKIMRD